MANWEKEPRSLGKFLPNSCLVSPQELFDAIVGQADRVPSDRVWVQRTGSEKGSPFSEVAFDLLGPRSSDNDFDGYFRRILKSVGSRQVGVNVHRLQVSSTELWFRFRCLLRPLLSRIGLPGQSWDLDTFVGTYRTTPFGIHRDNTSNFAYGVFGHRVVYAWPEECFSDNHPDVLSPDGTRIERHLPEAIALPLGPGDLVYWPSSYWHVVLSDGAPSGAIYAAAYLGYLPSAWVTNLVEQELTRHYKERTHMMYTEEPSLGLPPSLQESLGRLKSAVVDGNIQRRAERSWHKLCSSDGFTAIPAPDRAFKLPPGQPLRLREGARVSWIIEGSDLRLFCNGHQFVLPMGARLAVLLERFDAGQTIVPSNDELEITLWQVLGQRRAFK